MGSLRQVEDVMPSAPAGAGTVELAPITGEERYAHISKASGVRQNFGYPGQNALINGGFDFGQRIAPASLNTISNVGGRTFGLDRWGITNETASVQVQRVDTIPTPVTNVGARFYSVWKKLTNAGKFVGSQVLEANVTAPFRGRYATFQIKAKQGAGSGMVLRMAVLALSSAGTQDTMPATFATTSTADGTDPTWGTNLSAITPLNAFNAVVSGNGASCTLTSAFQTFAVRVLIPTTCKNIVVVFFTNADAAAADELWLAEAQFCDGLALREWCPMTWGEEFARAQRYYFKTFAVDTLPAQAIGIGNGEWRFTGGKAGATSQFTWITFPVQMRVGQGGPAPTLVTFSPAAVSAEVRDITAAQNCTATALSATSDAGVRLTCTGNAGDAVGDEHGIHVTVDCEI